MEPALRRHRDRRGHPRRCDLALAAARSECRPAPFKHIMIAGFFNVAVFNICSAFAQLVRRNLARGDHHLFDADLGERARLADARRPARPCAADCARALHRRTDDPGLAAVRSRRAARRLLRARLRLRLDDCHRLHEMGEDRRRSAGQCGMAASVRHAAAHLRHAAVRRLSAGLARSAPRAALSILFIGLFGVGLAHFLWWAIVGKLPTITASIGSLLVPVVGVIASRRSSANGRASPTSSALPRSSPPPPACCCSRPPGTTRCRSNRPLRSGRRRRSRPRRGNSAASGRSARRGRSSRSPPLRSLGPVEPPAGILARTGMSSAMPLP